MDRNNNDDRVIHRLYQEMREEERLQAPRFSAMITPRETKRAFSLNWFALTGYAAAAAVVVIAGAMMPVLRHRPHQEQAAVIPAVANWSAQWAEMANYEAPTDTLLATAASTPTPWSDRASAPTDVLLSSQWIIPSSSTGTY